MTRCKGCQKQLSLLEARRRQVAEPAALHIDAVRFEEGVRRKEAAQAEQAALRRVAEPSEEESRIVEAAVMWLCLREVQMPLLAA